MAVEKNATVPIPSPLFITVFFSGSWLNRLYSSFVRFHNDIPQRGFFLKKSIVQGTQWAH